MNIASRLYATNFFAFMQKALRTQTGRRLDPSQRYLLFLAHAIEQFFTDGVHNLLINLPGRHLKTFVCSICMPAFTLGLDPTLTYLIITYSEELAEDIVRQIRDIMTSNWYKAAFSTRLSKNHSRKGDFTTERGGRVRAVAINSVTGKGAKRIIIDDPHNVFHWDDARRKDRVIQAFEILATRGDDGSRSKFLVVAHRVAEDDLSAHLLRRGDFPQLAMPLFAPKAMRIQFADKVLHLEKNEALRPDVYSRAYIETLLKNHRGVPFSLYHQQGLGTPQADSQLKITDFPIAANVRRGEILASGIPVVLSVDPAQSTSSGSRNVIHVYAVRGAAYLMLQAFAEKCTFERLLRKIIFFVNKYNAAAVLIENTARGPDLIERLRSNITIPVIAVNPRGSKSDRLRDCTPIIKAGRLCVRSATGIEDALVEILMYPSGANDDHVDALTNMLLNVPRLNLQARICQPAARADGIASANHQSARQELPRGIGFARGRSIFKP